MKPTPLMALDYFLGLPADQDTLAAIIQEFEPRRQAILRTYFSDRDPEVGRKKVEAEFAPPAATLEDRVAALETLTADLAQNIAALKLVELPPVVIGSTAPKSEPDYSTYDPDPADTDERKSYRLHVTHQATQQWIDAFGKSGFNGPVDEEQIGRRIVGVYYQGTLTKKGPVWEITGINRYSMDGVILRCVVDKEVCHVSQIEKVDLSKV
jgi:hypothetical protein